MTVSKVKNFYFFRLSIVNIKIKIKIVVFSKMYKNTILHVSAFWKSLSWFSNNLSSFYPVRLSTLKKTKNKLLIKLFIKSLFFSDSWVSFSLMDVVTDLNWDTLQLLNNLKSSLHSKNDISIFQTNWNINKIFNTIFIQKQILKSNYFLEKYFKKEKYCRAVSFSNTLKFYFFKYFTFFLSSKNNLKNLFLINSLNLKNNYFLNFQTFKFFFSNIWFFIFLKKNKESNITNFFKYLDSFSTHFKIINFIIFLNGFIFNNLDNLNLTNFNVNIFKNINDNIFISIFLNSTTSAEFKKLVISQPKNFLTKKSNSFFDFLVNSQLYTNKQTFIFLVLKLLNSFLVLKLLNSFLVLKLLNSFLYLKCQRLDN